MTPPVEEIQCKGFKEYCEELRQQSIIETNVPFIMVIQNGVAATTRVSNEILTAAKNKDFLAHEVMLLVDETKIKGEYD